MATSDQLKSLVNQMPDPDKRGMYCTDIDKDKIEKAIVEIHKGGSPNVLGLIDMLVEARPGRRRETALRSALPGQLPPANQGRAGPSRVRRDAGRAARRQPPKTGPGLLMPGTPVGRPSGSRPGAGQAADRR